MKVNQLSRIVSYALASWLSLTTEVISAKGLEELSAENPVKTPQAEQKPAETSEPEATQSAKEVKNKEIPQEKPQEPQKEDEVAKKLSNKLRIGTGFARVIGKRSTGGDFATSGMGEILVSFPMKAAPILKFDLNWLGRYVPVPVTAVVEDLSYEGVWESYTLGVLGRRMFKPNVHIIASLDGGIMLEHLRQVDMVKNDNNISKHGVSFSAGLGMEWEVLPKLFVGPRAYATTGSISLVQIGGNATVLF